MEASTLIPRWKISMKESNGVHNYTIDGEDLYYPGVTTVLGVADKSVSLVPWSSKITAEYMSNKVKKIIKMVNNNKFIYGYDGYDRFWETLINRSKKQWKFERDKAGDLGTRFHELMEDPSMTVPKDLEIAMKSANLWLRNTKLRLVKGRTRVISKKYGFGGEWDALMQNEKGQLVVVDFKSGKRLYDSAAAQCSAYGQAFRETFGVEQECLGLVVRFGKEKVEFEEKEVLNMDQSFEYFKACLNLYNKMAVTQFGATNKMKGEKRAKS